MRRWSVVIGTSLMLASRRRMNPCSSNSQFSFPFRPEPLAVAVVPLVLETHGDPVVAERPQLLAQRVVELPVPFRSQEGDDLLAAFDELATVPPHRVDGVHAGGRGPDFACSSAASAASTFCRADASSNGGTGGLVCFVVKGHSMSVRMNILKCMRTIILLSSPTQARPIPHARATIFPLFVPASKALLWGDTI